MHYHDAHVIRFCASFFDSCLVLSRAEHHMILCEILQPFIDLSLSQADQLMFAMHFVKGMCPELFQDSVSIFIDYSICI